MRARRVLLPLLLSCFAACGADEEDPAVADVRSTYATFVGSGARGDFETWAECLEPEIRSITVAQIARWLQETAPGTAVADRAREVLDEYGLSDPETLYRVLDGEWDRAAFLGTAIPLVLEGMLPEQSRGLRDSLVPPPGPLTELEITDVSANARVADGAGGRTIAFLRVDGVWKLFTF